MKDYDPNKESWHLMSWNVHNLYRWVISQKLPADVFEWIRNTFTFNECFIKNYKEDSKRGYFLKTNI